MPSTEPSTERRVVPRFGRVSRAVHRSVAMLMVVCIVTAAALYNSSLSLGIGHRRVFELIHVYAGFALPVPLLLGLASRSYRDDLGRLNRVVPSDWRWLRSRTRRDGRIRVGKFNAGQKINAWLSGGAVAVLFGTGLIMYFPSLVSVSWRAGATFVHDWFALGIGLLVIGHVSFALKDPEARRGMRTGTVSAEWARSEHAAWAREMGADVTAEPRDAA